MSNLYLIAYLLVGLLIAYRNYRETLNCSHDVIETIFTIFLLLSVIVYWPITYPIIWISNLMDRIEEKRIEKSKYIILVKKFPGNSII